MNLEQRFEQGAGRRQSAGRVRFYGTECRRNPHLRLIDRRFEEYLPTFVLKGLRPSDLRYERLISFDRATTGAFPEDNVIPSSDGSTLYGLTQAGGANDPKAAKKYGTVFAVTVSR